MNNNYYQNAIFEFRLIDESEVYYPCPICRALVEEYESHSGERNVYVCPHCGGRVKL